MRNISCKLIYSVHAAYYVRRSRIYFKNKKYFLGHSRSSCIDWRCVYVHLTDNRRMQKRPRRPVIYIYIIRTIYTTKITARYSIGVFPFFPSTTTRSISKIRFFCRRIRRRVHSTALRYDRTKSDACCAAISIYTNLLGRSTRDDDVTTENTEAKLTGRDETSVPRRTLSIGR